VARTSGAKRYAHAVFQIAVESGDLDRWLTDLQELAALQHGDFFVRALETPNLTLEQQNLLISERFPRLGANSKNLLYLLIERRRVGLLPTIFEEYRRLLDEHRGVLRAEVITALPLDQSDLALLRQRLESISGKKMEINAKVDPSIVGGVIARFGGRLLDGSTKSRLEALKKEIGQIPR
jgi:F-type H+-transporting ATPase subunit delta